MIDGRWQMADGRWQMADGRWQMADGRWQMAGGREILLFLFCHLPSVITPSVTKIIIILWGQESQVQVKISHKFSFTPPS